MELKSKFPLSRFPSFPCLFFLFFFWPAYTVRHSPLRLHSCPNASGWECIKVNPGISSLLPLKLFHTQTPKMASTRRVFKWLEWLPLPRSSAGRPHLGSGLRTPDCMRRSRRWRCVCRALFSLSHFSSSPPATHPITPHSRQSFYGWLPWDSPAPGSAFH